MNPSTDQFLQRIAAEGVSNTERLVALLWFISEERSVQSVGIAELCGAIESAGFGKQNRSRSREQLSRDRRTVKAGQDSFSISPKARPALTDQYAGFIGVATPARTNSVLDQGLFVGARGYTRRVVEQVNASYHYGMFDCCAVMCRRLLETLIIEAYEHLGRESLLKGGDDCYMMFAGLLTAVQADSQVSLGRSAMKGLRDFKGLGDLSAHNRRFNARQSDIDRVRDGLRVACEELLHLAQQDPSSAAA